MPVSLTSKKQRVVKNFFYPTHNILPFSFLPSLSSFSFPNAFLPSAFCAWLSHTLGHAPKMQLSRHFNGFFGVNVGKLLILKGFFRRDNVQNGALFFFCFSLFSRWRGYVLDFTHIFRRVLGVIMVLGAGATSSLSRIAPAWAQTVDPGPIRAEKWPAEGAKSRQTAPEHAHGTLRQTLH